MPPLSPDKIYEMIIKNFFNYHLYRPITLAITSVYALYFCAAEHYFWMERSYHIGHRDTETCLENEQTQHGSSHLLSLCEQTWYTRCKQIFCFLHNIPHNLPLQTGKYKLLVS